MSITQEEWSEVEWWESGRRSDDAGANEWPAESVASFDGCSRLRVSASARKNVGAAQVDAPGLKFSTFEKPNAKSTARHRTTMAPTS